MSNIEIVSSALTEWLTKVAKSVLPKASIPAFSNAGKVISGLFGIDLSRYSLWDELGFLLNPTMRAFVEPYLNRFLSQVPDEKVEEVAMEFVNSFIEQCQKKGSINIFGIELKQDAFLDLREIMARHFTAANN